MSRRERGNGGEIHHPSFPASIPVVPFHQQKTVCTIAAHEGTLAAITFNASGSKLASASEKVSALSVFTGSPPAGARRVVIDDTCLVTPGLTGLWARPEFISEAAYQAWCGILMPLLTH